MFSHLKLEIVANKASMQPPVGPILGQYGIPAAKFCQDFNDTTKNYSDDLILRVNIIYNTKQKKIIKTDIKPHIGKLLQKFIYQQQISIIHIYQIAFLMLYHFHKYPNNISLYSSHQIQSLKNLISVYISQLQSLNVTIKNNLP